MNLGGRVKKAREARGWRQEDLAEKAGTSQANLSALESRDSVKSELVFVLADALRVNPRWLQTGEPDDDTGLETEEGWSPKSGLQSDEARLINLYRSLPAESRPGVHTVIEEILALYEKAVRQTPTRVVR